MATRISGRAIPRRTVGIRTISTRPFDCSHLVIGGGVVGLAIGRALQREKPGREVVIVERHSQVGTETSSRNSEVIHAGLYYAAGSLKSLLCRRGRDLLYRYCREHQISHDRCGKWIVAQDSRDRTGLDQLIGLADDIRAGRAVGPIHPLGRLIPPAEMAPMELVSADQVAASDPPIRAAAGAIHSPWTGIVDSHGLMTQLRNDFEAAGGICSTGSEVVKLKGMTAAPSARPGSAGWSVTVKQQDGAADGPVMAAVVVNAAGHGAVAISNSVLPASRRAEAVLVKGTYFGYSPSRAEQQIRRLVYPAPRRPEPGSTPAAGLGTHLTLDLAGRIRFGPDVSPACSPDDVLPASEHLDAATAAIQAYFPSVDPTALFPDYAGVRPKLAGNSPILGAAATQPPPPFHPDFYIAAEPDLAGFVNLLAIESPGLTSALAIGELVVRMVGESSRRREDVAASHRW